MASQHGQSSLNPPTPHFQQVLSDPRWSYFRLSILPSAASTHYQRLDATTVRLSLLQALSTYLGDHGASISIDILQIEHGPQSCDVIVRIPHQDRTAFAAAVSTVGGASRTPLHVKASADWLSGLAAGSVNNLFDFSKGP